MAIDPNRYKTTTSLQRWVEGTDEVLHNLAKELKKIEDSINKKGMYIVVLYLLGKMKPLTPVGPGKQTNIAAGRGEGAYRGSGNLVGSYWTKVNQTLHGAEGIIGNNASYALFVHEFPEWYNYTKTGTGPKFMEKVLKSEQKMIIEILARSARNR